MRYKKGLTIIECLLSIIILAIMLTAGMAFYFYAQAGSRWSVNKRIAIEMASAELESIKNMAYTDLPTLPVLTLWSQKSGSIAIGNYNGQKNVYVLDAGVGYKQVRVVVTWQDAVKSGQSSVSLDTYIAP
jgi:prepilin-type N-terminal cleavage/methylation domain-containing protein